MNALPTIDLQTLMEANEKIEWLSEKIAQLEDEIRKVKSGKSGWVTLDEAAAELKKTSSAVRQRLHHKTRPMPEGKALRQAGKGCAISIHLPTYRKLM